MRKKEKRAYVSEPVSATASRELLALSSCFSRHLASSSSPADTRPADMTDVEEYSADFLHSVRQRLTEEVDKSSDEERTTTYDEKEYHKFLTDDDYFKHYIKRKKGDLEASVAFLIEILKWRKRLGISDLTERSFPKEFYDFGGVHVYGSDIDGNVICHVRLRLFSKIPEILDILKKFVIFQMMKADEEGFRKSLQSGQDVGWILLFDCTGAGLANADLEMCNFLNSTLKSYFPHGQKYVLSHNLPWLLNAIKSVIFAMLPSNVKRRIRFSNDKTIHELIPRDQLPDYMAGTCSTPYPVCPRGVLTTSEMAKESLIPLTPEEEARVHKYYDKVYHEIKSSKGNKTEGA